MKLRTLLFVASLLSAAIAAAQSAPDQLNEGNWPITPIAIIVNGGGDVGETWGRPRALQSYDGSVVLLYAQGLPDLSANPKHDQIWLFRNPNNSTGWSTEYNAYPKVRILPGPPGSGVGSDASRNYAHHWPYKMHGRYYMVAQEVGDPSADNFRLYLLGKSSDGINWTWRRFLHVREGISLDQLAWKDISIGGVTYNYGFVAGVVGGIGIGAIRFRQDGAAGGEWGYDFGSTSTALAIWSGGTWVTVPTCASIGDTSGYDFCMYRQPSCGQVGGLCPNDKKIDPQLFLQGRHPSLHRLARHNNKYELWNHGTRSPDTNCGCEDTTNPTLENANTLQYRQVFPPTTLTQDPATTVGPVKEVGMDSPAIRCMPSDQRQSRNTPFRLEWTLDMLYSRTGDNKTNPFNCTQPGWHYIVRTRLETGTP